MTKKLLFCAAVVAALGGCAANQPVASTDEVAVRTEYPTGSNIPRKTKAGASDGVSTYDREALERARDQTAQEVRPGLPRAQ